MFIQLIILLSLTLTSCITSKSSITTADRETKHAIFSPGIHHITGIKEIVPLLRTLDERDLVAWDVDQVILTGKDLIHRPAVNQIGPKIFKETVEKYGLEKALLLRSRVLLETRWELVDEKIPAVIHDLQNNKVRTIALTAVRTNSLGQITDPMQWRVDSLRELGVNFKWPTPLDKQVWEDNTGYLDGVVGTGGQRKGTVLLRFLDKAKFKPRTVVFIDDKLDNVENVQEACKRIGIENFYGFQFEAEAFAKDPVPDPCMLRFQLEEAAQGRVWPSDQEALDKIKSGKYKCGATPE